MQSRTVTLPGRAKYDVAASIARVKITVDFKVSTCVRIMVYAKQVASS